MKKKERYDILVVEDKQEHQTAAKHQLREHNLVITNSYIEAIKKVDSGKRPDVLLTDMFFPYGNHALTEDQTQERPLGYPLALYAARSSIAVPRIAILSDLDHHSNAISASFDNVKELDENSIIYDGVSSLSTRELLKRYNSLCSSFLLVKTACIQSTSVKTGVGHRAFDFMYTGKDDLNELYFRSEEHKRPKVALRINNSFLGLFDVRDFTPEWMIDGKIYDREEIAQQKMNTSGATRVKNWKAALETILNGPVSTL